MIDRLESLYELQLIDSQLDELEELRGDLPLAVNELKGQMKLIQDQIDEKEEVRKTSKEKIAENETEVERLKENLTKFKAQLYQVRNNKEYDALTKEIDHSETQVDAFTKENEELENSIEILKNEIEEITPDLEKLEEELKNKETDLTSIINSNEKEEVKWRDKRESAASKVRKPDLNTYMRIRKARSGIAVATVNRGACSGCHNVVPPQRQLEIKQNRRIFTCEACGRMLVSGEVADKIQTKF
ncbi:MAG: zinc ribbon domain-containing protein [Rhodothermaceae bacterium]